MGGSRASVLVLDSGACRQGPPARWRMGCGNPRLHRGGGLAEGRRAQDRPGRLREALQDDEPDRRLAVRQEAPVARRVIAWPAALGGLATLAAGLPMVVAAGGLAFQRPAA